MSVSLYHCVNQKRGKTVSMPQRTVSSILSKHCMMRFKAIHRYLGATFRAMHTYSKRAVMKVRRGMSCCAMLLTCAKIREKIREEPCTLTFVLQLWQ